MTSEEKATAQLYAANDVTFTSVTKQGDELHAVYEDVHGNVTVLYLGPIDIERLAMIYDENN
jgi:hypothetical protein